MSDQPVVSANEAEEFDLVIVGTGSGNSILGPEHEGLRVAVVERGAFGGTCLNRGCIPSKMLVAPADLVCAVAEGGELGVEATITRRDWAHVRGRAFDRIDPIAQAGERYRRGQSHVTVVTGIGEFVADRLLEVRADDGPRRRITAPRWVLAAGARPVVPDIPGLDRVAAHTSDTIMRLDRVPDRLVVLGGGFIAAELGHVFEAMGSHVSIVTRGTAMLAREDEEISERFTLVASSRFEMHLETTAVCAEPLADGFRLWLDSPTGRTHVDGDVLLVAVGRVPNGDQLGVTRTGVRLDANGYVVTDSTLQTDREGIWALGDVRNPLQLKHVANREAAIVRHNLANPRSLRSIDERAVPHAVFGHPQIGAVGATEQELRARGVDYLVGRCDVGAVAYGWATGDQHGMCKVLIDPASRAILGAHILGPSAAVVIQPLVQAMQFGTTCDQLAREVFWPHPALSEVVENALLDVAV